MRFANALATAATFAAGLRQAFRRDSMLKHLNTGRAAEGGLQTAQMAVSINDKIELIERK